MSNLSGEVRSLPFLVSVGRAFENKIFRLPRSTEPSHRIQLYWTSIADVKLLNSALQK